MSVYVSPLMLAHGSTVKSAIRLGMVVADRDAELAAFLPRIGVDAQRIKGERYFRLAELDEAQRERAVEAGARELTIEQIARFRAYRQSISRLYWRIYTDEDDEITDPPHHWF